MTAIAVAGCGGSNPTALLATAMSDAAKASAFRVTGSALVPGTGRVEFDLDVVPNRGLRGSFTVSGVRVAVINVNGTTFVRLRASRAARLLGAVIPRALSTRWVKNSTPQFTSQISRVVGISHLFASTDGSGFIRRGSTTVKGMSTVTFEDPTSGGDVSVREGVMPYPLSIELPSPQVLESFSDWNERVTLSPPPDAVSASKVKGPPKVRSGVIANGTLLPSTPHSGVRTFRAVGYAIEFDYPAELVAVRLGTGKVAGQNRNGSHVALAVDSLSMIAVSRFPGLPIPVDSANIQTLSPTFDRIVSALAGHSVAVSPTSARGIPLLRFAPFSTTLQGARVNERIFNAFVGDDEYELRCQYLAADEQTIQRACGTMIATLARASPPTR